MKGTRRRLSGAPWLCVLLGVALAPTVMSGAALAGADDRGTDQTGLVPGDAIDLSFWQEPGLNGEFPIDERGIAVLPLLGEFEVTGVTPGELRRQLLVRYQEELKNPEVRVTPLRRIPILGAVRNPGLYRIDATLDVADALALAGGAADDGRRDQIILLRDNRQIRIPLEQHLPVPGQFRSGDRIMVPQRSWLVRNSIYLVTGLISASAIIYASSI
ncbi:MAG: polysaccharide biosynthesis/export family protein [Candidatus Eiseniibacteriota bacterium]|jgi:protein involved in polysaccharide export with SLBB domain